MLQYWIGVPLGRLISWGEDPSLALAGHPSSDSITTKILIRDIFYTLASLAAHLFLLGWLKLNLNLSRAWKCVPTAISGGVDISEVKRLHSLRQMSYQ